MGNLIEFFRMVISYLLVFGVIALVAAAGMFTGIKVWKKKDKKQDEK